MLALQGGIAEVSWGRTMDSFGAHIRCHSKGGTFPDIWCDLHSFILATAMQPGPVSLEDGRDDDVSRLLPNPGVECWSEAPSGHLEASWDF